MPTQDILIGYKVKNISKIPQWCEWFPVVRYGENRQVLDISYGYLFNPLQSKTTSEDLSLPLLGGLQAQKEYDLEVGNFTLETVIEQKPVIETPVTVLSAVDQGNGIIRFVFDNPVRETAFSNDSGFQVYDGDSWLNAIGVISLRADTPQFRQTQVDILFA